MTMRIKDFYALVDLEKEPDISMLRDLKNLIDKYPLFQAGLFIYIKCLYVNDSDKFSSELRRIGPFVHDRRSLFYYVMSDVYGRFRKLSPKKEVEDRTDMLISAFFETLEDKEVINDDPLENAIVNSSMASLDYFSYLGVSEDDVTLEEVVDVVDLPVPEQKDEVAEPKMRGQSIIDSFISKSEDSDNMILKLDPFPQNVEVDSSSDEDLSSDEKLDDDFFFTQTLADIYIKQKKYDKAYEIIKRLSLNYPEKNIYFADQLSFLEKNIKISNNK